MNAADVHRADDTAVDEASHRRDVAGQQNAAPRIGDILRQRGDRVRGRVKIDLHLRRYTHAIQLLLPIARRDSVVDEDDEPDVERLSPSDDDLPVNESVVDAEELDRHRPCPPVTVAPCTAMAARPRSAACRAASGAERDSEKTKSRSVGRFAPATSTASSMPRKIRRDAIVQLPA